MRKVIVTGLAALAFFAFVSGAALACGSSKASDKSDCSPSATSAKQVSAKNAKSAKSGCPYSKGTVAGAESTAEESAKHCEYDGKCEVTSISVSGMTCGGCEQKVSAALTEIPGVIKVVNVSYKEGMAQVCFDPTKTTGEALTTAIADKGFQAEIISAVAESGSSGTSAKLTGAKAGCCAAGKSKAKSEAKGTH